MPRLSLIRHCRYISRCLMVIGLLFYVSTTRAFMGFPFFPWPPYVPPTPPTPTTKPVAPASITAPASVTQDMPDSWTTRTVPGSWTVSWSASAGASYYELWESLNGATWAKVYSGSATSKTVSKTLSGTFKYRAKACNVLGCSPYSAKRSVAAVIGTPSSLTLPAGTNTDGNFRIGWSQRTFITSYLQSKEAGYWANIYRIPFISTGWTITNKSTGNYSFRLRTKGSFCFYGCLHVDHFELPKHLTVIRKPATPPTPTIANKTDEQDTEYIVNWQAQNEASRYELYRRKAAIGSSVYGSWSQVSNTNVTRRLEKMSLTGHYQYRVRACNYSCSGYSGIISTTVRLATPKKPNSQIPTFDYVADGNSNIKADTRRPKPSWSNNPLDTVSAASVPTGQDNVGAVGGAHEVGQDGSANYSIRIPAPTGRGGLTPELSLAYNSNGGNTELGIGWDIGGTRLIHRCSSNYALHGEVRGIRFDNEDRLCMDGQPLVAVSGSYGKNGAKYRTVAESYSEITSLHTEGSLDSTDSSSTANAFRVKSQRRQNSVFWRYAGFAPVAHTRILCMQSVGDPYNLWVQLSSLRQP